MSKSRLVLSLVLAAGTAASAAVSAGRYFPFDLTASPAIADVETPKSARVSGAAKKATLTKKDSGSLVAEDPIYKIADGITAPKLVSKTEPKYTQQARDEKIQGTVVLEAVISAKGVAEQIKVLESLDAGLDKNAVDAVGHWVFEPGMKDGKPVRVRARIEVNFKLK